jgi:hypothetical protein
MITNTIFQPLRGVEMLCKTLWKKVANNSMKITGGADRSTKRAIA